MFSLLESLHGFLRIAIRACIGSSWLGSSSRSSFLPRYKILDPSLKHLLRPFQLLLRVDRPKGSLQRQLISRSCRPRQGWPANACFPPRRRLCKMLIVHEFLWNALDRSRQRTNTAAPAQTPAMANAVCYKRLSWHRTSMCVCASVSLRK